MQSKKSTYPILDLPETGSVESPDAIYIIGEQLSDVVQKNLQFFNTKTMMLWVVRNSGIW